MAAHHREEGDPLRLLDGQPAEQDLVEQGEDGGVGADPEGQGEDGHHGEGLGLAEPAEGEPEILDEASHAPETLERVQRVARNSFVLTREEAEALRSQSATSKPGRGGRCTWTSHWLQPGGPVKQTAVCVKARRLLESAAVTLPMLRGRPTSR